MKTEAHRPSNSEVDWTEVIDKMTDDLERTRNLLETKTAAWRGALVANSRLHEKIAGLETTVQRLADDNIDLTAERDKTQEIYRREREAHAANLKSWKNCEAEILELKAAQKRKSP